MPRTADLTVCLPQLAIAFGQLRQYAEGNGISFKLAPYGAFRTEQDTTDILAFRAADYAAARERGEADALALPITRWRPIAPYGQSWHNYGAAFDIIITTYAGYPSADDALHDLKNAASMFGLRSNVPNDPGHFELAVSLETARQMWIQYNGSEALKPTTGSATLTIVVLAAILLVLRKRS